MGQRGLGLVAACLTAVVLASCGGGSTGPTPPTGGGNGGGQQSPPNTPPQIKSITASDTRIEVGTPVTVTAVVEDAETPVANLTYAWSSTAPGTFSGSGATVTWTAGPDAKTPSDYTVTLTVTERYTSGSATLENKAATDLPVHVNNSPKELADMSLRFLGNFANSSVSPDTCIGEFSDNCSGKAAELKDIRDNRHDFQIQASSLQHTGLSINSSRTSATVHTACKFTSLVITTSPQSEGCLNDPSSCKFNTVQQADGDCWTTNVYEKGRWWICESHYTPKGRLTGFERAFFGISRLELP